MQHAANKLMLLGAPGAGKGTVAKGLVEHLGITHLSTGDLLRAAVAAGTTVGREAKGYMDAGQLVPDDVIVRLVAERSSAADCKGADGGPRFLLDGFPRTLPQADALDTLGLAPDLVVHLAIDDELLVTRLTGRRSCPGCGAPYHVAFQPPAVADVCDRCGTALVHRADDQEGPIRQRLAAYHAQTAPLVSRYADRLVRVDGAKAPATVLADTLAAVATA